MVICMVDAEEQDCDFLNGTDQIMIWCHLKTWQHVEVLVSKLASVRSKHPVQLKSDTPSKAASPGGSKQPTVACAPSVLN